LSRRSIGRHEETIALMVSDAEQAEVVERACTFQMANALNSVTLTSAHSTASALGGQFVIISNLTSICWKDIIWTISLISTVVSDKGRGISAAGPLLIKCVIRYGHENILTHLSPKVEPKSISRVLIIFAIRRFL
jgi:hypothetical protein